VGGVLVGLLALAVLASAASPGFPVPHLPAAVRRALDRQPATTPPAPGLDPARPGDASPLAIASIPAAYLALYLAAAPACPRLTWQVLAGIGKVESDHGRSSAPGVHSGLNRAGCCAGPMQFNITNGPPSTWDAFGRGSPYDPGAAIPAAARKLCANGLALRAEPPDPCPHVLGSPALHLALKRYNNACWYVHEVITLARRYTATTGQVMASGRDPFLVALAHNRRLAMTRARGCDPAADLAAGRLDVRVVSLLAALTDRHAIRVSCLRTGHSRFVRGTRRISNHTVWRAVDIDRVDGVPVSPGSPAARALATWLDRLDGPLRPAEIGSPFPFGRRPWFTDEGHQAHLHIGYTTEQAG
jgi:hypothetical protein